MCLTFCAPMDCSMPGLPVLTISQGLPKLMSIEISDAIQASHPPLTSLPIAFNLSLHQGLFQWISSSHKWPKYWSFSFSISPSDEYSRLISFKIDWFDLLVVQGTLKSLLQHHNLKASILWWTIFFMVQLSHLYMTTGKTMALTMYLCWQSDVFDF